MKEDMTILLWLASALMTTTGEILCFS